MDDMQHRYDDEIDLVELFKTIWDGKWQIIGSVAVAAVAAVGVLLNMPSEFTAKTEIRPITTVEADRYRESNALGFFEVDRGTLRNLFIEQLQQRQVLVDAIKSLRLIDRANYETEAEYEFAVLEFADSIEILPPINEDGSARGEVRLNWSLVAEYYDEDLWVAALTQARDSAFEKIRVALTERFDRTVAVAEAKTTFQIEDIRDQMANVQADFDKQMEEFEVRLNFDLEDVQTRIDNVKKDYERKTSDRLAFLREQAEIARKLGVAKNTIEAQTFGTQAGLVANVQTNTPFYLRGYEAIDKEIELIESREDPKAFITGLYELEQEQRELLQDTTLERAAQEKALLEEYLALERKIRALEQDQTIERAKVLFASMPIASGQNFVAASMIVEGTEFDAKRSKVLVLALVIMLTGMLAVIYVLIANAMRKRAEQVSE